MSQIEDVSNRGTDLRNRLYKLLQAHGYPSDVKTTLLMAYVDIVLEHHEAILLLIKHKLLGSGFALVRPLFDTLFRALWINQSATQSHIDEIASRDDAKFPPTHQILAEIDRSYSTDDFFQSFKAKWTAMCSYTHSGLLQVIRRVTGGDIMPNYNDAEILEVLNATNTALILLTRMFFVSTGCYQEAAETEKMMLEYGAAITSWGGRPDLVNRKGLRVFATTLCLPPCFPKTVNNWNRDARCSPNPLTLRSLGCREHLIPLIHGSRVSVNQGISRRLGCRYTTQRVGLRKGQGNSEAGKSVVEVKGMPVASLRGSGVRYEY